VVDARQSRPRRDAVEAPADERGAPIRIEKTGRGRFRIIVDAPLDLVCAEIGAMTPTNEQTE
jgi:hypothetical protein